MGGSGYAGAELARRLLHHPAVELVRVASVDHVGRPLSAAHPNLEGLTDLTFEDLPPKEVARGVDVVLLGLPTAVSVEVVPILVEAGVKVVDLSGAFRLGDAATFERCYGLPHPRPDLLARAVYGLPELNRERLRGADLVGAPGCFATAIELGVLPLARAGWLSGAMDVVGITGSSGSGVVPSPGTHHPVRAVNLRTYKPLEHQHAPEIVEALTAAGALELSVHFVPVSAPLGRGIFATSFVRVPADTGEADLAAAVAGAFAGEPFVRVPRERLPEVVAVAGSNYAEVRVVPGPVEGDRRLVTCFSALDNLVKGGAGQVVQCMNLALGLDERAGLTQPGTYP